MLGLIRRFSGVYSKSFSKITEDSLPSTLYLQPDGTSAYFQPDGSSYYLQP